ncbi:hypothetical protein ACNKHU_05685 [Shigella flexneri]
MSRFDRALAADPVRRPSVNEMAELFDIIDPIAIAEVRERSLADSATELVNELLAILQRELPERVPR